jgi:hypothetical protein
MERLSSPQAVSTWIDALNNYTDTELGKHPAPGEWSIGQLYMHLIQSTRHFLQQARICMLAPQNTGELPSDAAMDLFQAGQLPDTRITGPRSNQFTPEATSREELIQALQDLANEMQLLTKEITNGAFAGRTKHPGLGYFTAEQWLQFAEIHLQHHFRQKTRIDAWLASQASGRFDVPCHFSP